MDNWRQWNFDRSPNCSDCGSKLPGSQVPLNVQSNHGLCFWRWYECCGLAQIGEPPICAMHCEQQHSMTAVFLENRYCKVFLQDQVQKVNSRLCHKPPNSTSRSVHSMILWRCYRYSCLPRRRKPPRRSMVNHCSKELPSEWFCASGLR